MQVPVLVLHANGTNRDRDAAWAVERAGGAPEIVHVNALISGHRSLSDYGMLVLPGGFSYADDLGAGRVWALLLRTRLGDAMRSFIDSGKPVLGICNGFQALLKSGLLLEESAEPTITLTHNASGQFECRWVRLLPDPASPCIFTRGLHEPIDCPVAHGEGNVVATHLEAIHALEAGHLTPLRYLPTPQRTDGYPGNPNGSAGHIAAICNPRGNVLGLMPHPENHLIAEQHPRFHRGERGHTGLVLFERGVSYAAQC